MKKFKKSKASKFTSEQSDLCKFSNVLSETKANLFWDCHKTKEFVIYLENDIATRTMIAIIFSFNSLF